MRSSKTTGEAGRSVRTDKKCFGHRSDREADVRPRRTGGEAEKSKCNQKDWNIRTEVQENRLKRTSHEACCKGDQDVRSSRTTGEAGRSVRNDNDDR